MPANEVNILIKATDQASAKIEGVAGKLQGPLRAGAMVGAAAILGVGAAAINMAADFETGFAEVTTLFNAPKEQINALRSDVLDLSAEMGVNAKDATEALYNAISAGVAPGNAVDFLRENTRFAVAGVTDLNTAVDLSTTVMNAWGLESGELSRVHDVLFATVQGGKTTVAELGASMFQVAPAAAAAGLSIEDVGASLAALTLQGVPTTQAATSLRAAIVELGKEGTKANESFTAVAGEGFRTFIEGGGDMADAMEIMQRAAEDQGVALSDLFGAVEGGLAVQVLAGAGFEDLKGNMDSMLSSTGITQEAFEEMNETFGRQVGILTNQLKVILVELGLRVLPVLTDAIQAVLPHLRTFADVAGNLLTLAIQVLTRDFVGYGETMRELPASIQPAARKLIEIMRIIRDDVIPAVQMLAGHFVTGMQTILDAVRPMFEFIFNNKIAMIAALVAIGAAVAIAMGPASLAIAAIAGLIIGIGLIRDNWEMLKTETERILGTVTAFIDEKMGIWDEVIVTTITAIVGFIRENWDTIQSIIQGALDLIVLNITDQLTFMRDLFLLAKAIFTGEWGEAWDLMKGIVTDRMDFMRQRIDIVMGLIQDIFTLGWAAIRGLAEAGWNRIQGTILTALQGLRDVFIFALAAYVNFWAALPGNILDVLGDLKTLLLQVGKDIVQGLWDGMEEVWEDVTGWLGGLGGAIVDLKGPPGQDAGLLVNTGKLIIGGLKKGMQDEWAGVEQWLGSLSPTIAAATGGAAGRDFGAAFGKVDAGRQAAKDVLRQAFSDLDDKQRAELRVIDKEEIAEMQSLERVHMERIRNLVDDARRGKGTWEQVAAAEEVYEAARIAAEESFQQAREKVAIALEAARQAAGERFDSTMQNLQAEWERLTEEAERVAEQTKKREDEQTTTWGTMRPLMEGFEIAVLASTEALQAFASALGQALRELSALVAEAAQPPDLIVPNLPGEPVGGLPPGMGEAPGRGGNRGEAPGWPIATWQPQIIVNVEDRSPAAIAHAVEMAGLELGRTLAMEGV